MHKLFCFLLLFTTLLVKAQPKGFTAVINPVSFEGKLKSANANLLNIKSDFYQTKNLSLLEEEIKSKGFFYYQKSDKVRIEYTSPYSYLMVINNGRMLIKDEQKTSRINAKGSSMMQSINRIMIDCMQGTVFENSDFNVTVFNNSTKYLLQLAPSNTAMKKMFDRIDVYLNKNELDVVKLVMIEKGGDFTDMSFSNTKRNTKLNDALFKVK